MYYPNNKKDKKNFIVPFSSKRESYQYIKMPLKCILSMMLNMEKLTLYNIF